MIGALLCAGLSACGGGGAMTTTLPLAQFRARAEAVCHQSQQRFDQIQRAATTTPDEAERQIAALIDVSQQALDELGTLDPRGPLAKTYQRYLHVRDRGTELLQTGKDAASQRDAGVYLKAKRQAAAEQRVRVRLARALGLRDCAISTARTGTSGSRG
jgi:hypothetical protein